jgi:hypothetical protein
MSLLSSSSLLGKEATIATFPALKPDVPALLKALEHGMVRIRSIERLALD